MAVISKQTILDNDTASGLHFDADVVIGDFYFNDVEIIFRLKDIGEITTVDVNYEERKMDLQMRLIKSITGPDT